MSDGSGSVVDYNVGGWSELGLVACTHCPYTLCLSTLWPLHPCMVKHSICSWELCLPRFTYACAFRTVSETHS